MKNILPVLALFILPFLAFAQNDCEYFKNGETLESNHMSVRINTDGTLFHNNGKGHFVNPDFGPGSTGTIRKAGLWMGGYEAGTDVLKMAATAVESDDLGSDFYPGALKPNHGTIYDENYCNYMNMVWKVERDDVLRHREDYKEDGVIDYPIPSIMNWPGNGNPYILWGDNMGLPDREMGWAPFFDRNVDGIYDPKDGDFPSLSGLIPEELVWTVFNDEGGGKFHEVSLGEALRVEVQLTGWAYDCPQTPWVEDMFFTHYKIINQSTVDIDSFYAGIWVDFDLGCPEDDYLGSIPARNAFYAYNADEIDGDESGDCSSDEASYGEKPPVMSVQFFDHRGAKFNRFGYFNTSNLAETAIGIPTQDFEFYNYLTGSWRDGIQFTVGGSGYNPGAIPSTNFAFPDLPSSTDGWSMLSEGLPTSQVAGVGVLKGISNSGFDGLRAGGSMEFFTVFGFHPANTKNNIEIVDEIRRDELYNARHAVYDYFGTNHISLCECPFTLDDYYPNEEDEDPTAPPTFSLYPNPTTGKVTINFSGEKIYHVAIYTAARTLAYFNDDIDSEGQFQLDLSNFQDGLYYIRATVDGTVFEEKLVIY